MKIIIAGTSGFIGSELVSFFENQGHQVVCLTRDKKSKGIYWNPLNQEINLSPLEGSDVVINLCGESIFGRWTSEKKEHIRQSRLLPTAFLVSTLLKLRSPPSLYIGASAMGYYGDQGLKIVNENDGPGRDFLATLCYEWEDLVSPLKKEGIRTINLRLGVVLGVGGGILQKMVPLFKKGLGGKFGTGEQMMSWLALPDLLNIFDFVIKNPSIDGPVNAVSPQAISNLLFTKMLGSTLHRKTPFMIPAFILRLLFKEGASMFLTSIHAQPQKLQEHGFIFAYPSLEKTLKTFAK